MPHFWSAPAERSSDGALDSVGIYNRSRKQRTIQSAVDAALCRRTPDQRPLILPLKSMIKIAPPTIKR